MGRGKTAAVAQQNFADEQKAVAEEAAAEDASAVQVTAAQAAAAKTAAEVTKLTVKYKIENGRGVSSSATLVSTVETPQTAAGVEEAVIEKERFDVEELAVAIEKYKQTVEYQLLDEATRANFAVFYSLLKGDG